MISLRQFKKDMRVTPEDLDPIMTKEFRHLLDISENVGYSVVSDYAFKCVCCELIGMEPHYRVLKQTRGPGAFNFRKTDTQKIKSTKGIFKLDELKSEPEYNSHINVVRNQLVCDHCRDSVYEK